MLEVFDKEAEDYDDNFTRSPIGSYQRNMVLKWLTKTVEQKELQNIFEVNCGTGHDAFCLSQLNCDVLATDISSCMIEIANTKIPENSKGNLDFRVMDLRDIGNCVHEKNYDMVFSNFGGLNCLNPIELKSFFSSCSDILKSRGILVIVLMSKKCLWENLYFLIKGKSNRRNTKGSVKAVVGENTFQVWYYSLKEIKKLAGNAFRLNQSKPIGFFIPPSYLNGYFNNKKGSLKILNSLDQLVKNISFLGDYSDHIYIEMIKK